MDPLPYYHKDCGGVAISKYDERPDPDKHGNITIGIECAVCGESGTLIHGPNGGTLSSGQFKEI